VSFHLPYPSFCARCSGPLAGPEAGTPLPALCHRCSTAVLCLQPYTASHRPRFALLWPCARTHTRSQPFPCLELLAHALDGVFRHADPPPPPRSLLQASPSPAKAASRLRVSRRSPQTQARVDLTPGRPSLAYSGEAPPRSRAPASRTATQRAQSPQAVRSRMCGHD
jgi:hypothetical protein